MFGSVTIVFSAMPYWQSEISGHGGKCSRSGFSRTSQQWDPCIWRLLFPGRVSQCWAGLSCLFSCSSSLWSPLAIVHGGGSREPWGNMISSGSQGPWLWEGTQFWAQRLSSSAPPAVREPVISLANSSWMLSSKVGWSCVCRCLPCFWYKPSISSSLFHLIHSYSQFVWTSAQNHLMDGWEDTQGHCLETPGFVLSSHTQPVAPELRHLIVVPITYFLSGTFGPTNLTYLEFNLDLKKKEAMHYFLHSPSWWLIIGYVLSSGQHCGILMIQELNFRICALISSCRRLLTVMLRLGWTKEAGWTCSVW